MKKDKKFLIFLIIAFGLSRLLYFFLPIPYSWDEAVYMSLADGLKITGKYGYIGNNFFEEM